MDSPLDKIISSLNDCKPLNNFLDWCEPQYENGFKAIAAGINNVVDFFDGVYEVTHTKAGDYYELVLGIIGMTVAVAASLAFLGPIVVLGFIARKFGWIKAEPAE